jgi:hypothetical protein
VIATSRSSTLMSFFLPTSTPRAIERRGRRKPGIAIAALLLLAPSFVACRPSSAPASADAPARGQGLVIKNPVGNRPTFFDFGELQFGQHVEHVFQVENTEPDPVTIHDMLPSCGCTIARIAYTDSSGNEVAGSIAPGAKVITLPPGAIARLSMTVDTTHVETMNIDKLAQVRLRSDSKVTPYLTLEMHLVVRRTFRSAPDRIDLGESPRSLAKSGRADITPDLGTSRARIVAVEKIDGPFEASVDTTTVNDVEVAILSVTPRADLPIGPVHGSVTLSTTRDDGTGAGLPFKVPVSAQITADVVVHPALFALHAAPHTDGAARDESLTAEIELVALVPGERVNVRSTKATGSGAELVRVETTPENPDQHGRASVWKILLRAPEHSDPAHFGGSVTIELDHPRVPRIDVPYTATSSAPKPAH